MKVEYVITRSNRKSICIYVSEDEKVMVKAPFGKSEEEIREFLKSKRNWILKQLDKVCRQKELAFQMGEIDEIELRKIKRDARKIILPKVQLYAEKIGVSYGQISIRLQKSRWGSCSSSGNLNFNCLLVLMPEEVMDSVIVHELCHRKFMNHSRQFYAEILKVFPDYYRCDRWLKENGGAFLKRAGK